MDENKIKNKIIAISGEPVSGKGTTVKKMIEKLKEQGYTDEQIHLETTGNDFRRYFRSWEDLAHCGLPFIRNYSFSGGGQLESQHLTTHDLKLMGTIQTDNNGLRIKLVSDGKGWAIVRPLTLLQHEKLLSKLTIYSVPSPLIERKVYILGRSNISVDLYRDIVDSLANILNSEVIPRLTEIFSPTIVKSIEVYPYTNK